MSWIGDIKILGMIVDKILEHSEKRKERGTEAIASINAAWIATYDYLRNQGEEYRPNPELSNLWNEAARCARLINPELAEQLQHKSRFWIHPRLPRQQRILLLTEIIDELERLNMKFKK